MARPPLVLETWGTIRRTTKGGTPAAVANYRDTDGTTRKMMRTGPTPAGAERNLLKALKERLAPVDSEITRETPMHVLADEWVAQVIASDLADGSKSTYRTAATAIKRDLRDVRIREATVPKLDRYLAGVAEKRGKGAARSARLALRLMLAIAVRYGAIDHNPVTETRAIPTTPTPVKALRADDLAAIRATLHAHDTAVDKRGNPRGGSLRDIADMYAATGGRTAEVLALTWPDVELDADPGAVTISKTLIRDLDGKLATQDKPKSETSHRRLRLPDAARTMLLRRRVAAYCELVFPSSTGTPMWPENLRRDWRAALSGTPYAKVTPRAYRKAVATLLEEQVGTDAARDQLGHTDSSITRRHYIERAHEGPNAADVLASLLGQNGD